MITLVLDVGDATGTIADRGQAVITPSTPVASASFPLYLAAPYTVAFEGAPAPQVSLVPTDDASFAPPGWGYQLALENVGWTTQTATFKVPAGPATFTATSASPAVFTWQPAGALTALPSGTGVKLSGGSLPTGFSPGVQYYVLALSATTFNLAASPGGAAMASGSTGSGSVTVAQYNLSSLALS